MVWSSSTVRRLVRVLTPNSAADVLQRPRDRESCAGRVEVGPLEAYNFAASHSGVGSEVQRRVQALHPGGGEESVKFGCGPGTCRWSFG